MKFFLLFLKLFYIIQKNLRLVFRNWTTFLLLVLGPLFLILIVGYAFSGNELHDVLIGVHAAKDADIQSVVDALASENVAVVYFPKIDRCITAMNHSVVNICADFSADFGEGEGRITFYYGATRYNLVRYILEYLKEQVSLTSEQISLEASEKIFSDINQFVVDMQTGQEQVHQLQESALLLRGDLVATHDDVVAAQEQFTPPYLKIKQLQAQMNRTVLEYSEAYGASANVTTLIADLIAVYSTLDSVNTTISSVEATVINSSLPYDSAVFASLYASVGKSEEQLTETIITLNSTTDLSGLTLRQAEQLLHQVDLLVGHLDDMNASLATTEQKLATHITNIDLGVSNLDGLSASFDTYISTFSGLNQSDAEQFLHPITAVFSPIPADAEENKTAIVFPIVLVFMLSFISILLSNMLVLNETHSPAYFRNFLIPVNNFFFIVGLFVTNLVLIGFQLFVFFIVAYFSFGVNFFLNLPVFLFAVLLASMFYILCGMLFGYFISQRQTSLLFGLFFALIMFFFSDVIFPLEIMPPTAAFAAQFNPLVVIEGMLRQTLFFGHGIADQWFAFSLLGFYIAIVSCFVIAAYYWNRRRR